MAENYSKDGDKISSHGTTIHNEGQSSLINNNSLADTSISQNSEVSSLSNLSSGSIGTNQQEIYGWALHDMLQSDDKAKISDEHDSVDYLPSYNDATSLPSAPPLSPMTPSPSNISDYQENLLVTNESNVQESVSGTDINSNVNKILNLEIKKIQISINLIRAAKRLITFLKLVDNQGDLYSGEKVKAAIYRYEHMWLPLVAKETDVYLSPPLDVHWVWVVHMLSPQHYEQDCLSIVGKVIPHRLMTYKALTRSQDFGRAAWEKHYINEPWELSAEKAQNSKYCLENSKISYNLEYAINRQSAFFYQVSLEHYNSKAFLCKAAHRYKQFLALKKSNQNQFLVPCYDMDIIWHSHQVYPVIYRADTVKILGQLFPHDDSVNDRSDGSKLMVSDAVTRDLWLKSFGTTFRREGAMFRGHPPTTYLKGISTDALKAAHLSAFHVEVTKVKIQGNFSNGPLKVKLKHDSQKLIECTLFHSGSGTTVLDISEMNLKFSISEMGLKDWAVLKISSEKKLGKFLKFLGKGTFWCMTNFLDLFSVEREGIITKVFTDEESPSVVELELKVSREVTSGWVPIGIMTGDFIPCVLEPDTLLSQFGMVTSTKSNNQDIYLAEMATHRLLNESDPSKPQIMEIEVRHSKHFLFSSIHLFMDNPEGGRSLVGLTHTVDPNTIPSPTSLKYNIGSKLEARIATLNLNAGERAMIIKTKGKDWALLVGRWEGLRRGVKGSFSARGIPGSPGYLVVKFYCPIGAPPVTVTLPYEKQVYAFQLPDLYIDMEKGRLQINRESEDFVEQIALGLTITVMHVLCQPRPVFNDSVDGEPAQTPLIVDTDAPKRIPTERLKFLAALGFFCASTPTNTALTKEVMENKDSSIGTYKSVGGFWPMYVCPIVASDGVGACGSCGGCGGCGGGVFETISPPSAVVWGSSKNDAGGGGNDDGGTWGESGGGDSAWGWSGDSGGGGGTGNNLFTAMFEAGDGGGDGGGCGGCGGCGG